MKISISVGPLVTFLFNFTTLLFMFYAVIYFFVKYWAQYVLRGIKERINYMKVNIKCLSNEKYISISFSLENLLINLIKIICILILLEDRAAGEQWQNRLLGEGNLKFLAFLTISLPLVSVVLFKVYVMSISELCSGSVIITSMDYSHGVGKCLMHFIHMIFMYVCAFVL